MITVEGSRGNRQASLFHPCVCVSVLGELGGLLLWLLSSWVVLVVHRSVLTVEV